MEKHIFIIGTSEEIGFLASYSKVSTPKMWGSMKRVESGAYKQEVDMRIPDSSQIENGRTYSFKNYLKRTNDLQLIEFMKKFDELREQYRKGEL